MFPIVLTFDAMFAFLDAVQIDLFRIVHGDQKFAYPRPIAPGDVLIATLSVAALRQIGGDDILRTPSEIPDAAGAVGCTTSVHPGPPAERTHEHSQAPSWRPRTFRVTRADLVPYAGASGD